MTNKAETAQDPLQELHTLLAQDMINKLKSGEEIKASGWDVMRKFLLDNDIRVEAPNDYEAYLQGIAGGNDSEDSPIHDPLAAYQDAPIPDPMTAYDDL